MNTLKRHPFAHLAPLHRQITLLSGEAGVFSGDEAVAPASDIVEESKMAPEPDRAPT